MIISLLLDLYLPRICIQSRYKIVKHLIIKLKVVVLKEHESLKPHTELIAISKHNFVKFEH